MEYNMQRIIICILITYVLNTVTYTSGMDSAIYSISSNRYLTSQHVHEMLKRSPYDNVIAVEKSSRAKRGTIFNTGSLLSDSQAQAILDRHNTYRMTQGSSDMKYMTWNNDLAKMAQNWADTCSYFHGQATTILYQGTIGQNLYVVTGTTAASTMLKGIQLWYDEIQYYNYNTGGCTGPDGCAHYTQMIWSSSNEIGCAIKEACTPLKNTNWPNGGILVCNYGPGGNILNQKPFKKGSACTDCISGQFWCYNSMCRDDCATDSTPCQCNQVCQNCATMLSNCTCECQDGNMGNTCSEVCADTDSNCNKSPGFPSTTCTDPTFIDYVLKNCKAMCGVCTTVSDASKRGCGATIPTTAGSTVSTVSTQSTQSTTTTASSSSSSSTTPGICGGYCQNGGTASASSNGQCSCSCTLQWQGDKCEFSRAEARIGVGLTLTGATVSQWSQVWAVAKPLIVQAINGHCNDKPGDCCTNVQAGRTYNSLEYVTTSDVFVGMSYPIEKSTSEIYAVVYANPSSANQLCLAALVPAKRKKRQADGRLQLSQTVLEQIINGAQNNITQALLQCCNTSLSSIDKPTVDTSGLGTGINNGLLGTMIGFGISFIIVIAITVIQCCRYRSQKNKLKKSGFSRENRRSFYDYRDSFRDSYREPKRHWGSRYDQDPYYSTPRSGEFVHAIDDVNPRFVQRY